MKKFYFLALLFVSSVAFSQSSLSFEASDVVFGEGPVGEDFFIVSVDVTNSSDQQMNVRWERDESNLFEGWDTQICDKNLCYLNWIDSEVFLLAPGESHFLQVYFWPNGLEGCSQVTLNIFDEGTPDVNFAELVYFGKTVNVECDGFVSQAVGIEDEVVQTLNLYPNPVMGELNVSMTNINDASTIEVYNLTGKLLDRIDIQDETQIRIGAYDWTEGMYILSLLDESNRVIKTQRFSKVQ